MRLLLRHFQFSIEFIKRRPTIEEVKMWFSTFSSLLSLSSPFSVLPPPPCSPVLFQFSIEFIVGATQKWGVSAASSLSVLYWVYPCFSQQGEEGDRQLRFQFSIEFIEKQFHPTVLTSMLLFQFSIEFIQDLVQPLEQLFTMLIFQFSIEFIRYGSLLGPNGTRYNTSIYVCRNGSNSHALDNPR